MLIFGKPSRRKKPNNIGRKELVSGYKKSLNPSGMNNGS